MSLRAWPEWLRYTLTALAGAAACVFSMALAWGDVRRDAGDAKSAAVDHERRLGAVEQRLSGDSEWRKRVDESLTELKGMLREVLKR